MGYLKAVRLGAVAAAAAVCAVPVAAPAGASGSAAATEPLVPTSTSWPTTRAGMVLAYPKATAGARPVLLLTADGGHHWRRLHPPPVPFPTDQDQPQLSWQGGVVAVTDGTRVLVSRSLGLRWSTVRWGGVAPAPGTRVSVSELAVTRGRMVAIVVRRKGNRETTALYSGSAYGTRLAPVRGVSVTGDETYGQLSAQGGLQVAFGADYARERYWYLRGAGTFVAAPVPCPVQGVETPGGVRQGRPVVLCSAPPSTVGPGETVAQVRIAPRLGAPFRAAGGQTEIPNPLGFASASDTTMTLAAAPGLLDTTDGGSSWTRVLTNPGGSFWNGLAFPSGTVGVATDITVDSAGGVVGHLHRSTDAGRRWPTVPLP